MQTTDAATAPPTAPTTAGGNSSDKATRFERDRGVAKIAVASGISHATVVWADAALAATNRLLLLQLFADADVSIFLMKLHPRGLSFAMRSDAAYACEQLLDSAAGASGFTYKFLHVASLVSTYAGAMRDLSGVIARIYRVLVDAKVHVLQTGDAYNAVHCLVAAGEADAAANALCREFGIDAPIRSMEAAQ